ncbi:phosphotransferase enzyme family protein [Cohnella thermotolerans]|uniref:phosphotransferase enzyme family protein n=1 Tax=Cohnella thermotolerans TaxID=329858 RepID=UPI0004252645|nr:phosphotransferase [Cohnella thermotolerans]
MGEPNLVAQDASLELYHKIARRAVGLYPLPSSSRVRLLNYSENATYLVEHGGSGEKTILRVNRPGYHSKEELDAELVWMQAIRREGTVAVPEPIAGSNGEFVQAIRLEGGGAKIYYCVMFSFLSGSAPDEEDEEGMVVQFEKLGMVTALLHEHSREKMASLALKRPEWVYDNMLGANPTWGRWQDGLHITPERERLFQRVSEIVERRLERFGRSKDRFGLIHADLRLANLLVEGDRIRVIDFDDCGYSWFLYDLASALSFIEHKPYVEELIAAWLRGYERIRPVTEEEKQEIPTFIMLRRLILVAWIGSHPESDTSLRVGASFTGQTERLAANYLERYG